MCEKRPLNGEKALSGRPNPEGSDSAFLIIGEMADNQPRVQTLEFFQTLAETASGRFLMLDALY